MSLAPVSGRSDTLLGISAAAQPQRDRAALATASSASTLSSAAAAPAAQPMSAYEALRSSHLPNDSSGEVGLFNRNPGEGFKKLSSQFGSDPHFGRVVILTQNEKFYRFCAKHFEVLNTVDGKVIEIGGKPGMEKMPLEQLRADKTFQALPKEFQAYFIARTYDRTPELRVRPDELIFKALNAMPANVRTQFLGSSRALNSVEKLRRNAAYYAIDALQPGLISPEEWVRNHANSEQLEKAGLSDSSGELSFWGRIAKCFKDFFKLLESFFCFLCRKKGAF
jgi:hypothetical protein